MASQVESPALATDEVKRGRGSGRQPAEWTGLVGPRVVGA
jgi:Asp-tRNA(Asn)/Glu-tRNA(Gln) amidotransferase A subunit family amidase